MKNFARFDDVENKLTQAFNRVVMSHNILAEVGAQKTREYIEGFDRQGQVFMALVVENIKKNGLKRVRDEVLNESA